MNTNEKIEEFNLIIGKIIIEENKTIYKTLQNILTKEEWLKLMKIWLESSSLLRINNFKTEFNKIKNLEHSKYYDCLFLWLQYYTDQITYKTNI
jgi:hypothetical protein